MSASLVGSEMCIRDSACLACRPPGSRTRRPPCRLHSPLAISALYVASVSYTHLTLPTICSV
eukprot:7218061-Alexandrium_andersonii.AAC.1